MRTNKQSDAQANISTNHRTDQFFNWHSPISHSLSHSHPLSRRYSTRWIAMECIPSIWASRPLLMLMVCCYLTAMRWVRETHTRTKAHTCLSIHMHCQYVHIRRMQMQPTTHMHTPSHSATYAVSIYVLISKAIFHVLSTCPLTGSLI